MAVKLRVCPKPLIIVYGRASGYTPVRTSKEYIAESMIHVTVMWEERVERTSRSKEVELDHTRPGDPQLVSAPLTDIETHGIVC